MLQVSKVTCPNSKQAQEPMHLSCDRVLVVSVNEMGVSVSVEDILKCGFNYSLK